MLLNVFCLFVCLIILPLFYSVIFTHNCAPKILNTGVMIPILKKRTSNPNIASNYRPITVSSVFSKLLELIILPNDVPLLNNQFDFRAGYSVSNGINLLNYLICYNIYLWVHICTCVVVLTPKQVYWRKYMV